jgi:hypothetical protein
MRGHFVSEMTAMAFACVTAQEQSDPLAIGRKADPCMVVLFSQMTPAAFDRMTPLRPIYLCQNKNPEMYYTKVSTSINILVPKLAPDQF